MLKSCSPESVSFHIQVREINETTKYQSYDFKNDLFFLVSNITYYS